MIDGFLKSLGKLSPEDTQKMLDGLDGTLDLWLESWGSRYNIAPERRMYAFMFVLEMGYKIAKRNMEADKWNRLIS